MHRLCVCAFLATLPLTVLASATPSKDDAPLLRARVFNIETGELGPDLFEGDVDPQLAQYDQEPNGSLLLVVGLRRYDLGNKVIVQVRQGKRARRFTLVPKWPAGASSLEPAWFHPILLDRPGACDAMTITVEVKGKKKLNRTKRIDFACGE
jgi:hypothetical protein